MLKLLLVYLFTTCVLISLFPANGVAADKQRVVLISIDGMRCDYLTKAVQSPTDLKIPNLLHFIQNGVWAVNGSVPAFPAQTFPSHTSMITGVQPSKHGIYINNLVDVANNNQDEHYFYMDVKVKTLIDLAFENNLVTAGVDWPVTVGAPYKYLFPGNVNSPNSVDESKWLYNTCKGPVYDVLPTPDSMRHVTDNQRGDLAALFYKELLPDLLTLHYNDLDELSHATGYMTQADLAQLEYIDQSIGELKKAIELTGTMNSTTWIIVSDHGFVNLTEQLSPGVILAKYNLTTPTGDFDYIAYMINSGGCSAIYTRPNITSDQLKMVDIAIQEIISTSNNRILKLWTASDLALAGGFSDAYVVLESILGVTFTDNLTGPFLASHGGGGHGWSPFHPEMMGSFIAFGPRIQQNVQLNTVRLVDIAPTIAKLLNIEMTNVDGRVLSEIFV